jgi:hypothetical protein
MAGLHAGLEEGDRAMSEEMKAFVKRGIIPKRMTMIDLLKACFEQGGYYVVQRPDDGDFHRRFHCFKPDLAGWLVVNWDEGRVFSKRVEVRWRKLGDDLYQVMVLAEEDIGLKRFGLESDGLEWRAVKREGMRSGIYLWGRYREEFGRWVETRIPRQFSYPVEEDLNENRFVQLGHMDYRAPNEAVQFVRLTEVI